MAVLYLSALQDFTHQGQSTGEEGSPSRGQAHICGHLCCVLYADLGTESVSGTLSSLQQCQPRDSFDMFAQTRGSASAEQCNPYVGALLVVLGTLGVLTLAWPQWPAQRGL